ncbi:hypothetical protein G6F70_004035 [Rhizopus microsporus]|uniref:HCP-like protein n=1 Tax=Rhizopus microsporus TaxID=58291 RepID=A0A0A1NIL7_RHIZD|nr:hypothetical protein G6F71_008411 [Rhizopus microsporus]KAG1200459.1 hypothetical protein G6F70_004035 [Rhizopus microsporus]KAG1207034.1 hypothetical protein G6F69_008368 [Rhizopus microsporus]KAG1227641.1 hypothetical protein G6F67_008325 [Rhizopus microsporus]KAG1259563.1 hypothetical protein G6F68_008026 [Rhizopus microsporus]
MADNDEQLQTNTYIWSQSRDQVTITFLVPDSSKAKDLEIKIERQYVKAGLRGQEPVFQAKLYQPINHFESLWQLEKNSMSPFSSLTASPNLSIASSYAFMSSPNHSPNSSMMLPEAVDTGLSEMSDLIAQTGALGSSPPMSEAEASQPASPVLLHTPPSVSTPPHLQKTKYRVLTIHLEKEDDTIEWVVPVSGPHHESNALDITSSYLLAQWFEVRMGDLVKALSYYLSAAERGHTASMLKVAGLYEINKETTVAKTVPEKDSKKAFEWYKKAADCVEKELGTNISNGPDPFACYVVGTTYGSGLPEADIEKDYQSALYYYNRCMTITAPRIDVDFSVLDQDHIPRSKLRNHAPHTRDEKYFCSSAFQTGLIYLYGSHPEGQSIHSTTFVDPNPDMAIRYWKEAALLGHAQACYNIGILYANGMGVERDVWTAGKWFGRAIKLDTTNALVVPEGVKIIDWDATKEEKKEKDTVDTSEKKKKKRAKRTKRSSSSKNNDDVIGAIVALGAIAAVAGVAWFLYTRGKKGQ